MWFGSHKPANTTTTSRRDTWHNTQKHRMERPSLYYSRAGPGLGKCVGRCRAARWMKRRVVYGAGRHVDCGMRFIVLRAREGARGRVRVAEGCISGISRAGRLA